MHKIFLKTAAFTCIVIFHIISPGCRSTDSGKADDQLRSILQNDNVELRFSINVDTIGDGLVYINSEAVDTSLKKIYQYPGIIHLDDTFISLTTNGSAITPNLNIPPSPFAGMHIMKVTFSDDMKFEWTDGQLTSKNKDSVEIPFEANFLEITGPLIITSDSVILTTNKKIPGYKVGFDMMAIDTSGMPVTLKGITTNEAAIDNRRAAIAINGFRKNEYNEYNARIWFTKELPVMYKGRKKGKFQYNYITKDIRFKLK